MILSFGCFDMVRMFVEVERLFSLFGVRFEVEKFLVVFVDNKFVNDKDFFIESVR